MATPYALLREALWRLSLEPDEQRNALPGTVVTDELAEDLNNAVLSLRSAEDEAGVALPEEVATAVASLNEMLAAPMDADLWKDGALDHHHAWAQTRIAARKLLQMIPQGGG